MSDLQVKLRLPLQGFRGGIHDTEVADLALASYCWDQDMGCDSDEDKDGLPYNILDL